MSHDRGFLDEVCTHMVAVDCKKLLSYRGNFSQMAVQRAKYDNDRDSDHTAHQVTFEFPRPHLALADSRRRPPPPGVLIQMENAAFQHEGSSSPVFQGVNFALRNHRKHDRGAVYALVGPNGGGKSTFLDLLCGEINPTEGVVARHGVFEQNNTERIFRYTQHFVEQVADQHGDLTPTQYLQLVTGVERDDAREALEKAGMHADRVGRTKVRDLSGGERVRMQVFDEPTNHLDTESVAALAEAINRYVARAASPEDSEPGAVVLVTHDARLLEEVVCELLVVKEGAVRRYEGTMAEYKEDVLAEAEAVWK